MAVFCLIIIIIKDIYLGLSCAISKCITRSSFSLREVYNRKVGSNEIIVGVFEDDQFSTM